MGLVIQVMEMADVLNVFFVSVFTSKTGLQESKAWEVTERLKQGQCSLVEEGQVRTHLSELAVHKSMSLDMMHP